MGRKTRKTEIIDLEAKSQEMAERIRGDLSPVERCDFQDFLDSFMDDIIVDLVRQFGGWNSAQTYGMVLAVIKRMIEAWQAGRHRLHEQIEEL